MYRRPLPCSRAPLPESTLMTIERPRRIAIRLLPHPPWRSKRQPGKRPESRRRLAEHPPSRGDRLRCALPNSTGLGPHSVRRVSVGAFPREPRKKTAVIWRGCCPSGSFRASRSAHVPTSAPSRRYGHSAPVKEFVKHSFGGPPFSFGRCASWASRRAQGSDTVSRARPRPRRTPQRSASPCRA